VNFKKVIHSSELKIKRGQIINNREVQKDSNNQFWVNPSERQNDETAGNSLKDNSDKLEQESIEKVSKESLVLDNKLESSNIYSNDSPNFIMYRYWNLDLEVENKKKEQIINEKDEEIKLLKEQLKTLKK
jgi:hypothetical protein